MSEIKRKSGKYPYRPTDNVEILKDFLKVEIGRLQGLIDRENFNIIEDSDYPHYEQGLVVAFKDVLSILEESNKEEGYMKNEYLDKLEQLLDMDDDQSTNILEALPLAHNHIVRIIDEAMHATTVEEHRLLMTEGSKQWLRYEKLFTDNDICFTGHKEEE